MIMMMTLILLLLLVGRGLEQLEWLEAFLRGKRSKGLSFGLRVLCLLSGIKVEGFGE